ncbi:MAG: phosphoribosyl-ATP diphosphatase [Alphaproteobacteria bacterium]
MNEKTDMIEKLVKRVAERSHADPNQSWTAQLLSGDSEKIIRKFGEEALELVMASQQKNQAQIIKESADVLYHLVVLWQKHGIAPEDVRSELAKREALSGISEKLSRPK